MRNFFFILNTKWYVQIIFIIIIIFSSKELFNNENSELFWWNMEVEILMRVWDCR